MNLHCNTGPNPEEMVPQNRQQRRMADAMKRRGTTTANVVDILPAGLMPAMNTEQAAIYSGLAAATLEGLRCKGGGPRFVRYGRKAVRYLIADLDAWMAERTVASTSEQVAA